MPAEIVFSGLMPPAIIPDYEAQIRALFARAYAYNDGDITLDQVMDDVTKGHAPLVASIDAQGKMTSALALHLTEYPNRRVLLLTYGAGRNLRQHLITVIAVARALQCDAIEARSRPSVARLFRRAGFYPAYTVTRFSMRSAS